MAEVLETYLESKVPVIIFSPIAPAQYHAYYKVLLLKKKKKKFFPITQGCQGRNQQLGNGERVSKVTVQALSDQLRKSHPLL